MILIAIDPGKKGGVAGYDPNSKNPLFSFGLENMTENDIIAEFRAIKDRDFGHVAVMEELQPFSRSPAAHVAVYARSYGVIKGALMTLGFRLHTVRSQKWQKALSVGRKKDSANDREWKNKLKAKAQELFPNQEITLQTADAFLILEWARRTVASEGIQTEAP
jgi:hypothetical protein